MEKSLPTLSINSKCNNNCAYCFQRYDNNKSNIELTIDEIKTIVHWIKKDYDGLIILGGEPLLHSKIYEVMNYISTELSSSKLITNLITKEENIIFELAQLQNMNWLINVTSSPDNKKFFDRNLDILLMTIKLQNNKVPQIIFSLTLCGNKNIDLYYISILINILKNIPKKYRRVRITPQLPVSNNTYKLYKYDEQISYLIEELNKNKLRINIGFDCGFNFCFLSEKTLRRLIQNSCCVFSHQYCAGPFIDIDVQKKVNYCHYVSPIYFPNKYYYDFEKPQDCIVYFNKLKQEFFCENKFLCKKIKLDNESCNNKCFGFCPALSMSLLQNNMQLHL